MNLNLPGGAGLSSAAAGQAAADPQKAAEDAKKQAMQQAEKAKKQAQQQAEAAKKKAQQRVESEKKMAIARLKRRIMMLVMLMVLAGIAAAVYYFKDIKAMFIPMPIDTVESAAEAASKGDIEAFQAHFTRDSVARLERAWAQTPDSYLDAREGSWEAMAEALLTDGRVMPELQGEKLDKGEKRAQVTIEVDGLTRTVLVVREDDAWKIDVPLRLENTFRLPVTEAEEANLPPEVQAVVDAANPDPLDLWWEGREGPEKEEEEAKSNKPSWFTRWTSRIGLRCSVTGPRAPAPASPVAALALLVAFALLARSRRR